jgi:HAD superfamily hydrolase (TIGR01490 family)
MSATRAIAFFDFDGTLTNSDTMIPFLRILRGLPQFSVDLIQLSPWLIGYAIGLVQNDKAKQLLLKQSLGGQNIHQLHEFGDGFVTRHLPGMIRADTFERLQTHQQNGDYCVLVSASLNIYLQSWANENGLDDCLCSLLETDTDNNVTGQLLGGNCYGEEKVKRIKTLLQTIETPTKTYAYGNSKGDVPMLEFVDEGYWVGKKITRFLCG